MSTRKPASLARQQRSRSSWCERRDARPGAPTVRADRSRHQHRARRHEEDLADPVVLPVVDLPVLERRVGCPNLSVDRPTSRSTRGSSQSTTLGPTMPARSTDPAVSTKRATVSGSRAVSSWTTRRKSASSATGSSKARSTAPASPAPRRQFHDPARHRALARGGRATRPSSRCRRRPLPTGDRSGRRGPAGMPEATARHRTPPARPALWGYAPRARRVRDRYLRGSCEVGIGLGGRARSGREPSTRVAPGRAEGGPVGPPS